MAVCNASFAFESGPEIKQFAHAVWGADQGAPRFIYSIAQTSDGYLWLATAEGLFRFDGQNFERYQVQSEPSLPSGSVYSLLALANGDLWVGFFSGEISLLRDGRAVNYGRRDGVPGSLIFSLVQESTGAIWAGTAHGAARLEDNRWEEIEPELAARALCFDRAGTLWFATTKSIVAVPKGMTKVRETGIDVGQVQQIVQAPNGKLWMVETTRSVRPVPLHSDLAPPDDTEIRVGSNSILFAREGDLWITTLGDGLRHAPDPEKVKGKIGRFSSSVESYTAKDGLSGDTALSIYQDRDGNIWVGTEAGLDRFRRTPLGVSRSTPGSPQVRPPSVESIVADGESYLRWTNLKLPTGTKNVQLNYTAASLTDPRQIKFRFKLDGVDTQWQDAGTQRTAYYTNLHPGKYEFRVISGNGSGVWNPNAAVTDFAIPPFWYQTTWFQLLCCAVLLLLFWALYLVHLRRLKRQFSLAMGTRVDERIRIARELHDTLLQSFHGLMFQFQAARNLLPRRPESAMQALDEAILATEEALAEGRNAIHDLRPEPTAEHDLAALLTAAGQELASVHAGNGNAPSFRVIVEGKPQTLSPMLEDEIYRIGREVIRNAFRHADASRIEVEIRYDEDQLRLRIRDDGRGIDPKVLDDSSRSRHWGLAGVRERVQRIGSRLEFWSEVGAGTEVELMVPAAMAYEKQRRGRQFRLFRTRGSNGKRF
jgi:signal transduction histidine kinase